MAKLNQRTLKLHLKQLSPEELLDEIAMLYDKFEPVKEFYLTKLTDGGAQAVLEDHKYAIRREFFPSRGLPPARLSVARKAVADFKKISNSPADLAELMLFYVETGVQFTREYGDIDSAFYNSMEGMFDRAAKHIVKHGLQELFESDCHSIVNDAGGTGWGFHDTLSEIYSEHFGAEYGLI